jgi:RND family efflux transporter MFP subunit
MFEVGSADHGPAREYPGQVSPATNVEIGFEVSGRLAEFPVFEGQEIELGAVIAKLDPRDYQADLDAAQATAGAARAEYDRRVRMFEEDVISKQELERGQRNHEVAIANVTMKQKALDDTVLRAPFDGIIARKIANDFDNVVPMQGIVQLQTGDELEIVVNVPERDYAQFRPGLSIEERNESIEAHVVVSAVSGRKLPAMLKEYATTADPTTRTFRATFSFDRPDDVNVLPGMTAKLVVLNQAVPLESLDGWLVPVAAVAEDDGTAPYVWRVDPESMVAGRAPVAIGRLRGSSVEIRSGVGKGDLIVTSGVHQLREGMEVIRLGQ